MCRKVDVIDFPEMWISHFEREMHDLQVLEIDNTSEALSGLLEMYKKDTRDFMKLLNTLRLQLHAQSVLLSPARVSYYDKNRDIIEFKSNKGHARICAFFTRNHRSTIMCTHTYWKTTGKYKKQRRAFQKAERLRTLYFQHLQEE